MQAHEIKAQRVPSNQNTVRVLVAGRASYFAGIEPRANDADKPEKGMSWQSGILIPRGVSAEVLQVLNQAVMDAVEIGVLKKWKGHKPMELDMPIRDGNIKFTKDPEKYSEYKDMFTINAKKQCELGNGGSQSPPIWKYLSTGEPITSMGVIESGDWVVFDINFYPFRNRADGVAAGLNGGSFIKTGERFGGSPSGDSITEEANKLYGDLASSLGQAPAAEGNPASDLSSLLGGNTEPEVKAPVDPLSAFLS